MSRAWELFGYFLMFGWVPLAWLFSIWREPIPGEPHDDEIDARLGRGSIKDVWPNGRLQHW